VKALLDALAPGRSVYVQGATGEALSFCAALTAAPERAAGVHFLGGLIPGMNAFDYAGLTPTTRLTTFMPIEAARASHEAGRVAIPPLHYSRIADYFAHAAAIDLDVLNVAPLGSGEASFGFCADFGPLIWQRAKRRCAIVNPLLPAPKRSATIPLSACEIVIDAPHAPVMASEAEPSAELQRIAAHVASLVPEGAAVQTGVGGAPAASLAALANHRGLTIRSGMITPGYRSLAQAGALAREGHVTGVALGDADFYRWVVESDTCRFADATVTHGYELGRVERFVSINSALEVDLFGQANIEWRNGRLVSAAGGAPDFLRAAKQSRGGRSIIALPATAAGGKVSRIVARLEAPTVSLSRHDTDTIVTEFGAAELVGKTADQRAEALIAIAAPHFRDALAADWAALNR
jgi:acyl-CoA hydrolase